MPDATAGGGGDGAQALGARLDDLHCHFAQGYYLGCPAPADEISAWMRQTVGAAA